jgi:hypothetical protein
VLSKAERDFIDDLKKGDMKKYSLNYKRVLKFKILKKRKSLTNDLLLINDVLEELESI